MPKTVLCIDDDVVMLKLYVTTLEAYGYKVLTAENGAKGLELLASEHVDCVVVDYRMPEMDGGLIAAEIKRKDATLPVIIASGFGGDIPESARKTVDAYLATGKSAAELLYYIRRLAPPEEGDRSGHCKA